MRQSFMLHFVKSTEEGVRHKWKFITNDAAIIADEVLINVPTHTKIRAESPTAVICGDGKWRIEYIKGNGYKSSRLIIE